MIALTRERERLGWTRFKLGTESSIHPSRVGQIENGRVVPYPVELARLATALEWTASPDALLIEVTGNDAA